MDLRARFVENRFKVAALIGQDELQKSPFAATCSRTFTGAYPIVLVKDPMSVRVSKWWRILLGDEGQGVSEYAVLLVLLVLIVITTVRVMGTEAQQVINKVNSAFGPGHGGGDN
jgi:Flp pilus assembly pilin Flp